MWNMSRIEKQLEKMGLSLPVPSVPVASYVPFSVSGSTVYISGQLPLGKGGLIVTGKVGKDVALEGGLQAARLCTLNVLAQLKEACGGDLNRVRRCVRLGIFVNAVDYFERHPEVANGASDLIVAVMGGAGEHCRAAVGAGSLPRGAAVEVDA